MMRTTFYEAALVLLMVLARQAAPAQAQVFRASGADPVYVRAGYRHRQRVENQWAHLKEWRALATRYRKSAARFLGGPTGRSTTSSRT